MIFPSAMNMQVSHPCADWAKSAGYASWHDAVVAMKAGAVAAGFMPAVGGKSTLGLTLLVDEVKAQGLALGFDDVGQLLIGLKDHLASIRVEAGCDAQADVRSAQRSPSP